MENDHLPTQHIMHTYMHVLNAFEPCGLGQLHDLKHAKLYRAGATVGGDCLCRHKMTLQMVSSVEDLSSPCNSDKHSWTDDPLWQELVKFYDSTEVESLEAGEG